jgi:hypothetical protein
MRRNQYDLRRWKQSSSVRAVIMSIDWCSPAVILPVPVNVCSYHPPIRPACLSRTVIPLNYFADRSETADLSRDDVSRGWIATKHLQNIWSMKIKSKLDEQHFHLDLRRCTASWRRLERTKLMAGEVVQGKVLRANCLVVFCVYIMQLLTWVFQYFWVSTAPKMSEETKNDKDVSKPGNRKAVIF